MGTDFARWACALALVTAGCSSGPGPEPHLAPGKVRPVVSWGRSVSGQVARVDSLSAEAWNREGLKIAGPVPLLVDQETGSFQGTLEVPTGSGRRIAVTAFERGVPVYQGVSPPVTVNQGDTVRADVEMQPGFVATLSPGRREANFGDSVDVTIVDVSLAPQKSISAGVDLVGSGFQFARALPGPDLPAGTASGYRVTEAAPAGEFFAETGSTPIPAGSRRVGILRFVACPSGDCPDRDSMRVTLARIRAIASGPAEVSLPATTTGATLIARTGPAAPESSCVSGQVRLDGAGVQGALVSLFPGLGGVTNADGFYCLRAPANTRVSVGVSYSRNQVNYTGGGSVTTGVSANCGGACSSLDFSLTPLGGGGSLRYFVLGTIEHSSSPGYRDSGSVVVVVQDQQSTGSDSLLSRVYLTPAGGSRVRLFQIIPGGYYASGELQSFSPFVPLDPGSTVELEVDFDADGTVDARKSIFIPGRLVVTAPAQDQTVPGSFRMDWTIANPIDSVYFLATASSFDTTPDYQGQPERAVRSHSFSSVLPGRYYSRVIAGVGPLIQFWAGGVPPFNFNGTNYQGWVFSQEDADGPNFTVGAVLSPSRDAVRPRARTSPRERAAELRRRLDALARTR